jgi:hypothetical protein
MAPASGIPQEMSASPLAPDVADTHRVRGLLTRIGHFPHAMFNDVHKMVLLLGNIVRRFRPPTGAGDPMWQTALNQQ